MTQDTSDIATSWSRGDGDLGDDHLAMLIGHITWWITRKAQLSVTCCIAASFIASEAMGYFGIDAKVIPVETLIFNKLGYENFLQEIPTDQWPPEAWSIGIIVPTARTDVGHVVVRANTFLLDPSAPQFDRPKKDLRVETPLLLPLHDGWSASSPIQLSDESGVQAVYMPSTYMGWKNAPDWRFRKKRYSPLVARVISLTKEVLSSTA